MAVAAAAAAARARTAGAAARTSLSSLQPARVVRRRAPPRFLRAASAGTAAAAEQAGAGANAAAEAASADYETVCGIETHVQLNTRTKAFCACELSFGAEPNKHTCPVCLGHPGTLPVLNDAVVDAAVKLGFALGWGCTSVLNLTLTIHTFVC